MAMQNYVQCLLTRRSTEPGVIAVHDVAFIPEQFAVVGKFLKIRSGDEWVNGWEVMGTGSKKTLTEVVENQAQRKGTRQASDWLKGTWSRLDTFKSQKG